MTPTPHCAAAASAARVCGDCVGQRRQHALARRRQARRRLAGRLHREFRRRRCGGFGAARRHAQRHAARGERPARDPVDEVAHRRPQRRPVALGGDRFEIAAVAFAHRPDDAGRGARPQRRGDEIARRERQGRAGRDRNRACRPRPETARRRRRLASPDCRRRYPLALIAPRDNTRGERAGKLRRRRKGRPARSGREGQALRLLGFGASWRAVGALGDARRLAAPIAQIIELGATHLAAAHDLDRIDHRRMDGEYALDPFAVGDLADGEALLQAAAAAGDADALIGLDAAALAFGDLDVDDDRVAGGEIGDWAGGAELGGLFGLQRLDDVHCPSPCRDAGPLKERFGERFGALFSVEAGLIQQSRGRQSSRGSCGRGSPRRRGRRLFFRRRARAAPSGGARCASEGNARLTMASTGRGAPRAGRSRGARLQAAAPTAAASDATVAARR